MPMAAASARSRAASRRPAGSALAPRAMSSPDSRRFAPGFSPGGTFTASPSTRTSSCMNTVSAPAGMGAPVKMRIASPAPSGRAAAAPACTRSTIASRVSPVPATSAWRTANPSTAELSNDGSARPATTSHASTRPRAARSGTSSISATGMMRVAISRSMSAIGIRAPANAKQSSVSCAFSGSPATLARAARRGAREQDIDDRGRIVERHARHARLRQGHVGCDRHYVRVIAGVWISGLPGPCSRETPTELGVRLALVALYDDDEVDRR